MKTLISVQDNYTAKIVSSYSKWAHREKQTRKAGSYGVGHTSRVKHAAVKQAHAELAKLGLTKAQADIAIKDAHDMALLEIHCEA